MGLVQFLIVGLAAGWMIGKIRRGRGYGLVGNLVIGAIGSLIGWFLMGFLKMETPNVFAQIAMAVVGAMAFFLVMSLFKKKKRRKSDEDDDD
jgi:uncharacterized membrane protein YeaQ/YmgE (transglycosylase-associated protein family)